MDFRNGEEVKESAPRNEETKVEVERGYFPCANESEESDYKRGPKDGAVAPKPSDVRNGDLVSLLLAATPPYLYNIPLVPQTFFFSEMLKSFVQAKTERQNLKAQQSHQRRQRKRTWREITPPKSTSYDSRDKPLELTTPKQFDERAKHFEKKKHQGENAEKKFQGSELGNFSVEKLANSSIAPGSDANSGSIPSSDVLPPAPPLWHPLLYPPHPPYGIDPLHFFIDLRVSAHFWDRKLANETLPEDTGNLPLNLHAEPAVVKPRHNSAFRVPSPTKEPPVTKEATRKNSQNVHYVVSSLKDIYKALDEREEKKEERDKDKEKDKTRDHSKQEQNTNREEADEERKCKDLRALIGLELVVDYVKQESDGEEEQKPKAGIQEQEIEA